MLPIRGYSKTLSGSVITPMKGKTAPKVIISANALTIVMINNNPSCFFLFLLNRFQSFFNKLVMFSFSIFLKIKKSILNYSQEKVLTYDNYYKSLKTTDCKLNLSLWN